VNSIPGSRVLGLFSVVAFLLVSALLGNAVAQSSTAGTPGQLTPGSPVPNRSVPLPAGGGTEYSAPTPLPYLYYDVLMDQIHLDEAAAEHEKQGKDGTWLRNHLQENLRFNATEMEYVRRAAGRMKKETEALDEKTNAMIAEYRKLIPKDCTAWS